MKRAALAEVSIIVALLLATGLPCARAQGDLLVYQHVGATNPTDEGWQLNDFGPGAAVGPAPSYDPPAWAVYDNWDVPGSRAVYDGYLDPTQVQQTDQGWTLRASICIPLASEYAGGSPMILFRNGHRAFQVYFGAESDSDPIVHLIYTSSSYITITLDGEGGGFHLYELSYDATSASASLTVDGLQRCDGYTGFDQSETSPRAAWGCTSSSDVGQGYFASVEFLIAEAPFSVQPTTWGRVKALYLTDRR